MVNCQFFVYESPMSYQRFSLAVLSAAILAGCAGMQPAGDRLESAYVILGVDGAASARAITTAARCPLIDIDGKSAPMAVRSPLSPIPLRPQAGDEDQALLARC
jgi:hypothetical protein